MLPVTSSIATEGKNSHVWGNQTVVMCGKIYKQTSGIFNILYNYDKSYMTNFSSKTANKYETVFGGTCITKAMGKYEAAGADTSTLMPYVNAAMNEDWDGVKGYRKTVLDSIK